jgi:hypothetical protein
MDRRIGSVALDGGLKPGDDFGRRGHRAESVHGKNKRLESQLRGQGRPGRGPSGATCGAKQISRCDSPLALAARS